MLLLCKVGDFIYIYVAAPRSEISYKCKVVEANIPYANRIVDDSKYYINPNDSENKSDKYVRIEMIKKFNIKANLSEKEDDDGYTMTIHFPKE